MRGSAWGFGVYWRTGKVGLVVDATSGMGVKVNVYLTNDKKPDENKSGHEIPLALQTALEALNRLLLLLLLLK